MRYYSNTITKPIENKLIKSGLNVVGANNLGRRQITIGVDKSTPVTIESLKSLFVSTWRVTIKELPSHFEITINKGR